MEAQDKITSQMKEAARNAELQAFPGMERVWERVTDRLDEKPENKVVPFFSYKKIAAAAAILITVGLGSAYLFTEKSQESVMAAKHADKINVTPIQTTSVSKPNTVAVENSVLPEVAPAKIEKTIAVPQVNSQQSGAVESTPLPDIAHTIESSATLAPPAVQTQTEVIKGKIVDENGDGIPGATVKLLGTANGTRTDIDGNYELEVVTSGPTLEVIAMGYRDQNIFTDENLNAGTVKLTPGKSALSDVVITMPNNSPNKINYTDSEGIVQTGPVKEITTIVEAAGYNGTQVSYGAGSSINLSKVVANNQSGNYNAYKGNQFTPDQSLTARGYTYNYSTSNIQTSSYNAGIAGNVDNAIKNAPPGVQVTNGSGAPGSGTSVQIRGKGSLSAATTPLIMVDGKPYTGDIAAIDPKNVAKMIILKDSAATSLYGAKGANGVIVITTKSGLNTSTKKHLLKKK